MPRINRRAHIPEPVRLAAPTLGEILAVQYADATVIGEEVLDEGGMLLIVGPTEVGKSWLLFQMALTLATGTAFLGITVPKRRRVYVAQAEIGAEPFQRRLKKLWGAWKDGVAGTDLTMMRGDSSYKLKLDLEDGLAALVDVVRRHGIEVVLLDPLRPFYTGDENSSGEVQALFDSFDIVRKEYNCAIVYSHHVKKPSQDADSQSLYATRGSGVITDRPDTIIRMTGMGAQDMVKVKWLKMRNREGGHLPDMVLTVGEHGLFVPVKGRLTEQRGERVVQLLEGRGETPQGEFVDECVRELGLSKRTAQRTVEDLVAQGEIEREPAGNGRERILKVKMI